MPRRGSGVAAALLRFAFEEPHTEVPGLCAEATARLPPHKGANTLQKTTRTCKRAHSQTHALAAKQAAAQCPLGMASPRSHSATFAWEQARRRKREEGIVRVPQAETQGRWGRDRGARWRRDTIRAARGRGPGRRQARRGRDETTAAKRSEEQKKSGRGGAHYRGCALDRFVRRFRAAQRPTPPTISLCCLSTREPFPPSYLLPATCYESTPLRFLFGSTRLSGGRASPEEEETPPYATSE